jgi:hypothetical protein
VWHHPLGWIAAMVAGHEAGPSSAPRNRRGGGGRVASGSAQDERSLYRHLACKLQAQHESLT